MHPFIRKDLSSLSLPLLEKTLTSTTVPETPGGIEVKYPLHQQLFLQK